MDAVISGRSGTALLIDGDVWLSFSVDDPDSPVYRSPADLRLLFGDAIDLLSLENTDRESVLKVLKLERSISSSLDLALMLLDRDLSENVREKAAAALENLIADERVHRRLEGTLYAHPLPQIADLHGALKYCHKRQAGLARVLLQGLKERQSLIKDVRLAWESIPSNLFESEDQRAEFHHVAVTEGLFRDLATADVNAFLTACESNSRVSSLPDSQRILRRWVSRLHRSGTAQPKPRKARAELRKVKPPASRIIEREVVIIGGGIVGALTAILAVEHGMKDVVVYDTPDTGALELENLRNSAWLQSGLIYGRRAPQLIAGALGDLSPHLMLSALSEGQGPRRFFERYFNQLTGWTRQFRFNDEVRRLLRTLPGSYAVTAHLPDVAGAMSNIMRVAKAHGVRFEQSNVRLLPELGSRTGFLIYAENEVIEPRFTVLSTDMGQGEYLDQLGLTQSPVWRANIIGGAGADLLLPSESLLVPDRRRLLHDSRRMFLPASRAAFPRSSTWLDSIVNFVNTALNLYCVVTADNLLSPFRSYSQRYEREDLVNALSYSYTHLQWAAESLTSVWSDRYPGLIAARPPAARWAFYTAKQILNEIRSSELDKITGTHGEPFYARFVRHKLGEGEHERVRNLYERAKKRSLRREQKR
jgi:hypothetical protein